MGQTRVGSRWVNGSFGMAMIWHVYCVFTLVHGALRGSRRQLDLDTSNKLPGMMVAMVGFHGDTRHSIDDFHPLSGFLRALIMKQQYLFMRAMWCSFGV